MSHDDLVAALKSLERYSEEAVAYSGSELRSDKWGEWVRLEDVYKALGLEVPNDV